MGYGGYSSNGGHDAGVRIGRMLANSHGGAKPKKTVFDTDQAIHVWAQQTQAYGRNAKASVFFEGPTIYSYGTHFPMASFAAPGVVLINGASFSSTTSGHQSSVRYAVTHCKAFTVKNCLAKTPEQHEINLLDIVTAFDSAIQNMRNNRLSPQRRRGAAASLAGLAEKAAEYQKEFFPRRRKAPCVMPSAAEIEAASVAADVADVRRAFLTAERDFNAAMSSVRGRGRSSVDAVKHTARRVIRTLSAYRRVATRAGAVIPKHSINDPRRVLRIWRAAKAGVARMKFAPLRRHWDIPVRFRENSAREAGNKSIAETRSIMTAQGHSNYYQRVRRFNTSMWERPRGFDAFDRFAREMKSTAELENMAREMAREEAERNARWEAERAAEREAHAKEMPQLIAEWRAGTLPNISKLRYAPCMLRVKGSEVQTSWGASFPVEHARKAWPLIKRVFAAGVEWHTNGHKIPLGHFKVDSIGTDGTLTAGCHTLSRSEVENCAALIFGPEA